MAWGMTSKIFPVLIPKMASLGTIPGQKMSPFAMADLVRAGGSMLTFNPPVFSEYRFGQTSFLWGRVSPPPLDMSGGLRESLPHQTGFQYSQSSMTIYD